MSTFLVCLLMAAVNFVLYYTRTRHTSDGGWLQLVVGGVCLGMGLSVLIHLIIFGH